MTELTVLDTGCDDHGYDKTISDGIASDNITGRIVSGIREYGGNPSDYRVIQASSYRALRNRMPDILVVSEEALSLCTKTPRRVKCGILLLPGDRAAGDTASCDSDMDGFDAKCIITYGMSPKNTITLSSINEDYCVLAVQREFLTSGGDMLERQEIKIRGGMRPLSLLAVSGTLLILGLKISTL